MNKLTREEELQKRIDELEREALDAAELEQEIEKLRDQLEDPPGQILADKLRALLAELTIFPERDCPEFYNALDEYDVAKARQ